MNHVRPMLVLASSTGGVGRHVASLVAGGVAAGLPVAVAGPVATDRTFGFTAAGARFFPVEIADRPRPHRDLGAIRDLARARTAHRASVLHAHGLRAAALAVAANRRTVPLVASWHNGPPMWGTAAKAVAFALGTVVARGADVNLGASSDLVAWARRLGARTARLGPVAATSPPKASVDRATARDRLDLGVERFVLAVGRLAPQKDVAGLLAAVERWRAVLPQTLLGLAGTGPQECLLRSLVDGLDLPVRFLGAREDVPALLAAADLAVISSLWEARSLFAQEALRAGVPLVATAVGGIPELVGDAAVLVPRSDPQALADAVVRVLTEPELTARLATAGPARAATWPTEADVQADALHLYRRLSGA